MKKPFQGNFIFQVNNKPFQGGHLQHLQASLFHPRDKQLQALLVAYTNGYYKIPRSVVMEDLAKKLQISRKTFEEHLRKAENKIINVLLPAMMLTQ
ncbi:MAG: helix-turn-helix domain-containing protein [Candidatus Odinarchaeota archaeon]